MARRRAPPAFLGEDADALSEDSGDSAAEGAEAYADAVGLSGSEDEDAAAGGGAKKPEPLHSRPVVPKAGPARWAFVAGGPVDDSAALRMTADREAVSRASSKRPLSSTRLQALARYTRDITRAVVAGAGASPPQGVSVAFEGSAVTEVPYAWTPLFSLDFAGGVHVAGAAATEAAAAASALWGHALLSREQSMFAMLSVPFDAEGDKAGVVAGVRAMCAAVDAAVEGAPKFTKAAGAALASIAAVRAALDGSEEFMPMWQQGPGLTTMNTVAGALRLADRLVANLVCTLPAPEPQAPGAPPRPVSKLAAVRGAFGGVSALETALVSILQPPEGGSAAAHLSALRDAVAVTHRATMTALAFAAAVVRPGMRDTVKAATDDVVWFLALLHTADDYVNRRAVGGGETCFGTAYGRLAWLVDNAPSEGLRAAVAAVRSMTLDGLGIYTTPEKLAGWPGSIRGERAAEESVRKLVRNTNIGGAAVDDALVAGLG